MEHTDRISELYKGEIFTPETQAVARERIHWICDRVEGRKVVDIGCSQGIVSILLARKGFEVVGVDTDAKAIEYAKADRAKEPAEAQERLTFVEGDIYDVGLPEHGFDTAIMGELLEHLVGPQEAINRAYALLSDGGRLIITTPFGLLRAPDHKQTFYVASLYKMIQPLFVITGALIIGRYLCLVCERRRSVVHRQIDSIDLSLVEMAEHQFEQRELALTEERDARAKDTAKLKSELNTARAELKTARAQLNTYKKETARLQTDLAKERRKLQQIRNSLPYQLGNALLRPVRRPGRFALRVAYRVAARSPKWVRGIIVKATSTSKMLAALQRAAGQTSLPEAMPRSRPRVARAKKAHVLHEIRNRITQIQQEMGPGSTYASEPRRKDLSIAVIMDKFTYECFRSEASLVTFSPDNWKQVLIENRPDFLFVESAWHGSEASWRGHIVNLGEKPGSQLPELVRWCREQSIPTAFWNKEDPAHYDEFLDAARLFDYVYTTDSDCIPAYQEALKHENVFCLPFAVQPRVHNPIGSGNKVRDIGFAGSWYEGRTEHRMHRKEQMSNVLLPALRYDVDIYDRNYSIDDDRYRFPKEYQPCIVGELSYDEMVYAYKMYKIFLNVNSVIESPTMFPRRVLEILASGTCVLSGYAKGIENLVGSDIVRMCASPEETVSWLQELVENKELRDRLAHLGFRKVMKGHTYEQRLDYVLGTVVPNKVVIASQKKGVSIVTCTNKLIYMENIFANYDRQQCEERELIVVLNNDELKLADWEQEANKHQNVRVYQLDETKRLGECLNYGIERSRFDYVAKFDDDDYYAPAYLADLLIAFDYSGADVVGKCARYIYFESDGALAIRFPEREHQFVDIIGGPTMVIARRVLDMVRFDPDKGPGEDTKFLEDCVRRGFRIYSADRFNFVQVRASSSDLHTWKPSDKELLGETGRIVSHAKDYVTYATC